MNKALLTTLILFLLAMSYNKDASAQQSTVGQKEKVLRHVVLFKFKESATAAEVKAIEKAFAALSTSISLIKGFEWGLNNSPENLNQELTHCFLVTFTSEKDRDAYLVHPKHKEFIALAGPQIDKATVVDFWTLKE